MCIYFGYCCHIFGWLHIFMTCILKEIAATSFSYRILQHNPNQTKTGNHYNARA